MVLSDICMFHCLIFIVFFQLSFASSFLVSIICTYVMVLCTCSSVCVCVLCMDESEIKGRKARNNNKLLPWILCNIMVHDRMKEEKSWREE